MNISQLKGLDHVIEAVYHSKSLATLYKNSLRLAPQHAVLNALYSCFGVAHLIITFWNGLGQGCIWS
jgi:hypothetical protein